MPLSEETQNLLLRGEDVEVEYKTKIKQEFNEILVAYANAEGGYVLFGVEDAKDENGRQYGKVVGIPISDRTKGQIQSRASQTRDPIEIEIRSEFNDEEKGVYIVFVKEGVNKPYCTGGGRYLIRRDGQNCTITPSMMLNFVSQRLPRDLSVNPSKMIIFEELQPLKRLLQQGLKDSRKFLPPFYSLRQTSVRATETLEEMIAVLTVEDEQLIEDSKKFLEISKHYNGLWVDAIQTVKKERTSVYSRPGLSRDEHRKIRELRKSTLQQYNLKLDRIYKRIAKRIEYLLQ